MSVIGGQNPIVQDGLVYILDFGNDRSYTSGSNWAQSLIYNPVTASFTGSTPNLINDLLEFTDNATLLTNQSFPGFSYNEGNLTVIFAGQTKDASTLITQDGTVAVVSTTSSIGYGSPQGNLGRNFPATGFNHVTLRFTTGSVDCFVNGIPTAPSDIFPSAPSSSVNTDFKVAGNYISSWTGSYSGSLGNLLVYNRELSDDEIYAIYLQQARRYGLIEQPKPYTVDSSVYTYTQAAGITGSAVISALDAFVSGLKANNLWNKMIAIYPFLGSDTVKTRYNLKDPSLNTTAITYSGSWSSSDSGSYNNNDSSYGILENIKGDYYHPLISSESIHLSYLSYDTPASGGYLMGVEETPGLPGDIAAPAAAYSVRKVRTAYTGSAMNIRRDFDDLTFDVGFDGSGNLDTGSLLTNMTASGLTETLPGDYSGLAAAYSLRKVSSSYYGPAIEVRKDSNDASGSIGFDGSGGLNTGSLLAFLETGSEVPVDTYSGLAAAYSLRKVVPTYAGNAIEIQSGSVSQSIGFNSFGDLDIAAIKAFAGSGDASVKTWYDQSGNNNHATQSMAANQPRIVYTGSIVTKNGKPALSFDGTNDYLGVNAVFTNDVTISGFVVASSNAVTTNQYLYDNSNTATYGGGYSHRFLNSGGFRIWGQDVSRGATGGSTSNGVQYLSSQISTTASGETNTLYQNGSQTATNSGTPSSRNAKTTTNIGRSELLGGYLNGSISEIIIYSSSQADNRTYIENNINSYYGIYTPDSVSTENAYVKTWYDQSGNNNHAAQAVTSSQPLIVDNGVIVTENGKPSIDFDGSDDNLLFSQTFNSSFSGFAVATNDTLDRADILRGDNSAFLAGSADDGEIWRIRTVSNDVNYATQDLNQHLHTWINDTTTSYGAIDGGTFVTASDSAINQTSIYIGGDVTVSGGTFMWKGTMQEIVLYTANLTESRGLIEDNINGYYNIFTHTLESGSGYVSKWYDQSGNDRHATQSLAANQPLILSSGSIITDNGKPSLQFDGSNDFLNVSAVFTTDIQLSSFSVHSTTNVNTQGYIYSNPNNPSYGGGYVHRYQGDGKFRHYAQTAAITANSGVLSNNTQYLTTAISYGTTTETSEIYINSSFGGSGTGTPSARDAKTNTNIGRSEAFGGYLNGKIQELIVYSSSQANNRQPIEQEINSYFNIYTPVGYNLNTNSLSLFSSPTTVVGAANNVASASFTTGGPLGLITVTRTGSSNYTLWKNRVPNKVTIGASTPQSNELYLNAANLDNALFSASQNNISFASVGAGLTDDEVYTYYELVDDLQTSLNRGVQDPNAFITTWDTRLTGSGTSNSSSIVLPLYGTQTITASWGDGTESYISQSDQVDRTHSYAEPGIYTVSITGQGEGFQFNNGGDKAKIMDIVQWGSISGSATNAFYGCSNLVGTAADAHTIALTSATQYFSNAARFNGFTRDWNVSTLTSTYLMFSGATKFNQDVGNWNVSNISDYRQMFYVASAFNNGNSDNIKNWTLKNTGTINMTSMFQLASSFNQPIDSWNVGQVTNMGLMFEQANSFNQSLNNWNVSNVTNMNRMFRNNTAFNGNISNWNVSKVTSFGLMFQGATAFNNSGSADINNWRPISCSSFSSMFENNTVFNQPIGNWTIGTGSHIPSTGINMSNMFYNADSFNQNIGAWNVEKATNMSSMFQNNGGFNNSGSSDINNWRPISCSNFTSMFNGATAFNQPIGNWPLSASNINMLGMFANADAFNQNIGAWNVEKVTSMNAMFAGTRDFNNSGSSDINNWRPISCSDFYYMFGGVQSFNQPIGNWPLSASNINMANMFRDTDAFNQDLGNWDTSRVSGVGMRNLFRSAIAFNNSGSDSINNWDVSNITTADSMFLGATAFNQNIGNWNVSNITNFIYMFQSAVNFNNGNSPDISNWLINTASAVSMIGMFQNARAFNQPIGSWDVSKVTNMAWMFSEAYAFNQDIGNWNLSSCTNFTNFMYYPQPSNYSYLHTIYDGWINYKLQPNIGINFSNINYSASAAEGKALLERPYVTQSIVNIQDSSSFINIVTQNAHNLTPNNKVFIYNVSGSISGSVNGLRTVLSTGSATEFTLSGSVWNPADIYDMGTGLVITGYGWNITDGNPV